MVEYIRDSRPINLAELNKPLLEKIQNSELIQRVNAELSKYLGIETEIFAPNNPIFSLYYETNSNVETPLSLLAKYIYGDYHAKKYVTQVWANLWNQIPEKARDDLFLFYQNAYALAFEGRKYLSKDPLGLTQAIRDMINFCHQSKLPEDLVLNVMDELFVVIDTGWGNANMILTTSVGDTKLNASTILIEQLRAITQLKRSIKMVNKKPLSTDLLDKIPKKSKDGLLWLIKNVYDSAIEDQNCFPSDSLNLTQAFRALINYCQLIKLSSNLVFALIDELLVNINERWKAQIK